MEAIISGRTLYNGPRETKLASLEAAAILHLSIHVIGRLGHC